MEKDEHQLALTLILGIGKKNLYSGMKESPATWPEIYVEIGKLLSKAGHIGLSGYGENTTMRHPVSKIFNDNSQ